jgi:mannose-6-phosphate isomerase-like protein (cupin superfamily)
MLPQTAFPFKILSSSKVSETISSTLVDYGVEVGTAMNKSWRTIPLQTITSPLGSIGVIEGVQCLPFAVRRAYFIYGVPPGSERGGHAHRDLEQVMIAVSGSLSVKLDSGTESEEFNLDSPEKGLFVPSGTWRDLLNFSENTVCLVLASRPYDESDYIRDYDEFGQWRLRTI